MRRNCSMQWLELFSVMLALATASCAGNPSATDGNALVSADTDAAAQPPTDHATGSSASPVRIKEISRTANRAAVVLDKHCPDIVQPYGITDNIASVGAFTLKEGAKNLGTTVSRVASGNAKGAGARDLNIPASARLAAKQMNWLPMSAERLYGERTHGEEANLLERESRLGKRYYPVADRMLQEVVASIGEESEYEFKLFIVKSDGHNAYARPGGYIYVDRGLIANARQHPKAYFAIAHEIAHVLQRHETKELQSMIVDSVATRDDLMKVISSARADPHVVLAKLKTQKNLFTQHHVDQELQADSCAARMLSRALPDAAALARSLQAFLKDLPKPAQDKPVKAPQNDVEKLAIEAHEIVHSPLRRHPTTQQRYDNLRALYAEITGTTGSRTR